MYLASIRFIWTSYYQQVRLIRPIGLRSRCTQKLPKKLPNTPLNVSKSSGVSINLLHFLESSRRVRVNSFWQIATLSGALLNFKKWMPSSECALSILEVNARSVYKFTLQIVHPRRLSVFLEQLAIFDRSKTVNPRSSPRTRALPFSSVHSYRLQINRFKLLC